MGLVVAVPVGPLGLLCVNRALILGPVYGLFSGLGVATADAFAAGIAAQEFRWYPAFLSIIRSLCVSSAEYFFAISAIRFTRPSP